MHGTSELVLNLWKNVGVPRGTYFGLLQSQLGKKNIPKGVNPVVDATFRNTSLDREDVFDGICRAYDSLEVQLPNDALDLFMSPVVVYTEGNGEFQQDPREDYMFRSPEFKDLSQMSFLRVSPDSTFRERAQLIGESLPGTQRNHRAA